MRLVQISDIHMIATPAADPAAYDPEAALRAVLARAEALSPDILLLTGDLAENGLPEEYARLTAIFASVRTPMVAIPGNHDAREPFLEALRKTAIAVGPGPQLYHAVEQGHLRILALDTLAPHGGSAGVLGETQLAWLKDRLAADDPRPVFIILHHPPFWLGLPHVDWSQCADGADLGALLLDNRRVIGVSCGHVHRTAQIGWAGTIGNVCPSVAWELPLGLREDEAPRLAPQDPGFQLHVYDPEIGLVTHTEYVRRQA